jgi:hypothetical protein
MDDVGTAQLGAAAPSNKPTAKTKAAIRDMNRLERIGTITKAQSALVQETHIQNLAADSHPLICTAHHHAGRC